MWNTSSYHIVKGIQYICNHVVVIYKKKLGQNLWPDYVLYIYIYLHKCSLLHTVCLKSHMPY
ncbi:hypothetical protein C0J52_02224 [Blattella germanica]|nr:hypothetical protein C0J52_02224 [Blattella germanica]